MLGTPIVLANPVQFLIPGGEGGGWDTTAREAGKAMVSEGIISAAQFTNYSGGGGGRALLYLVNEPGSHQSTMMVQSTPLVLRKLTGVIPKGFRDVRPISTMIAEYEVIVVKNDSNIKNLQDLIQAAKNDNRNTVIIGGSSKGSLDHITAGLLYKAAGLKVNSMRYAASDGGGDALDRLKNNVGVALVTGYGEVVDELNKGNLRAIGITSADPVKGVNIPTFKSQGYDVVFANWRGFFATKNLPDEKFEMFQNSLTKLNSSATWQEVRGKYGWAEFVKQGSELDDFLQKQEEDITAILKELDML